MPIDDLMLGLAELADAQPGYEEAELYYEGKNEELFASLRIARTLRNYEERFRLRLAKVPVDAVADRLEVAAVTLSSDDDSEPGEGGEKPDSRTTELNRILQDDVRDRNDMQVEEPEAFFRACEFGDSYIIASVVEEEDGERYVELDYNSPYEVRMIYDRSGKHKRFAIKCWAESNEVGNEYLRATLFYADSIEEWETIKGNGDDPGDWEPSGRGSPVLGSDGQPVLEPMPHPDPRVDELVMDFVYIPGVYWHDFRQIPVFHFRTRRPYGVPEHQAAYGPQDMIDKVTISHMSTIDYQAFPQRYFLEDPDAAADAADEGWDDDASATTESTPTANLQASPGKAWWIEGAKAAGQFEAAGARAFLDPLTWYSHGMSTVTSTPFHLMDAKGEVPSGESRRTAEAGTTKKVKRRQTSFGITLRELYSFCLAQITGEDYHDLKRRMNVRWVPAESIDPSEAWDLAGKKKAVGLPTYQTLLEHGYTRDQILDLMKMALQERKELIDLQRESFGATYQQNRDDRPDRPDINQNTGTDQPGSGSVS